MVRGYDTCFGLDLYHKTILWGKKMAKNLQIKASISKLIDQYFTTERRDDLTVVYDNFCFHWNLNAHSPPNTTTQPHEKDKVWNWHMKLWVSIDAKNGVV